MPPKVRIAPGDLATLDGLAVDALMLPFYGVTKQPRGPAGIVDWRLTGRIARLLLDGKFSGKRDEAVLMSPLERLPVKQIVLVGLGQKEGKGDRAAAKNQMQRFLKIAEDAEAKEVAIAPIEPFAVAELLETASAWLAEPALGRSKLSRVVLLDDGGALNGARSTLAAAAKEGGAALE